MAEIRLAAGVRWVVAVGVSIVIGAAVAACGGGGEQTPALDAPGGEVRVVLWVDDRAEVLVALEGRDSAGGWGVTTHPANAEVQEGGGGDSDGWWRSSVVLVEVNGAAAIRVQDGVFTLDPTVAGWSDACGVLLVRPSEDEGDASLWVSAAIGEGCDEWSPPLTLTPTAATLRLTTRIAARWSGDCADVRVEVRGAEAEWRALPVSRLCGVSERRRAPAADRERSVGQNGSSVVLPLFDERGVVEVRPHVDWMSAAVEGRVLSISCGLILTRGSRWIWRHRYDEQTCEWRSLERVTEFESGPVPLDPLDEQLYEVYDWEHEVTTNLLGSAWYGPTTLERAQMMVGALYEDFFGSVDGAPRVVAARARAQHARVYDPWRHEIQLRPDGLRAAGVVHEAAHAMLRLALADEDAFYLEPRHGPEFAAHLIAVWERYAEGFDAASARRLAEVYGVRVSDGAPLLPAGDAQTRRAVQEALAPR